LGVLGGAANIFPTIILHSSLEPDPIKLSITKENHTSPRRYHLVDLFE
jgi:hypothetical protein